MGAANPVFAPRTKTGHGITDDWRMAFMRWSRGVTPSQAAWAADSGMV
jgi:hypothetical protein